MVSWPLQSLRCGAVSVPCRASGKAAGILLEEWECNCLCMGQVNTSRREGEDSEEAGVGLDGLLVLWDL